MPLTPEHKAAWVVALRSGKYKQSNGFLYNIVKQGYCCIGVDAARQGWVMARAEANFAKKGTKLINNNAQSAELFDALYSNELTIEQVKKLMKMNDSGWTFTEIADWIEANL